MPKERIHEMNWCQFIDIKYVGDNITNTNININNKDKNYNIFISHIDGRSSNVLISNDNNDNDNHRENDYNKTSNIRSRKK